MSVEYYTHKPFAEAKALLLANLGEFTYEVRDQKHWVPEFEEFVLWSPPPERWLMLCGKEIRELPSCPEPGTLIFELFGLSDRKALVFMPWVERVLGVTIVDQYGITWDPALLPPPPKID